MLKRAALLAGLVASLAIAAPAAAAPVAGLAADVEPGPSGSRPVGFIPSAYTAVGNSILFVSNVGSTGYELWRIDGTGGIAMVKEINPDPDPRPGTTESDRVRRPRVFPGR